MYLGSRSSLNQNTCSRTCTAAITSNTGGTNTVAADDGDGDDMDVVNDALLLPCVLVYRQFSVPKLGTSCHCHLFLISDDGQHKFMQPLINNSKLPFCAKSKLLVSMGKESF